MTPGTPPETVSGGPQCSKGNKGVDFLLNSRQYIYTLFFGQISYRADSGFSSSLSGVFARLSYIKQARMAVPVFPGAAMEIKGSPFHPFLILLYISSPAGKSLIGMIPFIQDQILRGNPRPGGIVCPRMPIPVAPCAPMEIKGFIFRPFRANTYIPCPSARSRIMAIRAFQPHSPAHSPG
jgi:hypothetical protein